MENTAVVLESQVDWLTVTATDPNTSSALLDASYRFFLSETENHNVPMPWDWKGYKGAHCGSVSYGEREDGAFLQVTGQKASEFFDLALSTGGKATRIDLQVTAHFPEGQTDVAREAYASARAAPLIRGNRPKSLFYENSDGGQTCYVGSAASEHRGRIYDKWKESKNERYENCWRWEVQTRHERAQAVCERLLTFPNKAPRVAGYVWDWFEKRSVRPAWDYGDSWSLAPTVADRSDLQRKLQWLKKQVAPTIEFCRLQGALEDARIALGLCD